jgi:hypothetical protein
VVEGARLESVYRGNSIVGSNPTLSAMNTNTTTAYSHLSNLVLEPPPGAVTDMQNVHSLSLLCDPVNHAVYVRLVSVQHVPQATALSGHRTSVRVRFEA